MKNFNYYAMTADIVASRKFKASIEDVQVLIRQSLRYLNKKFKKGIEKEGRIYSGDSFQILFRDAPTSFLYYRLLEILIFPIEIRVGIAKGDLFFENKKKSTLEMYGDVYIMADAALKECKERDEKILYNGCDSSKNYRLINTLLNCRKNFNYRGNTLMYNSIQLLYEFLNPMYFYANSYYKDSDVVMLKELISLKIKLIKEINEKEFLSHSIVGGKYYVNKENDYYNFKYLELSELLIDSEPIYVKEIAAEADQLLMRGCWRRGFNPKIADIMGVNRQSVDRSINSMKYQDKRNFDGVLLLELEKLDK